MKGQTNAAIRRHRFQRKLRGSMTGAEQWLWQRLRRRQIEGYKFRRQHPFGGYILDFVSFDARVVIEVDGSQHMNAQAYDQRRSAYLEAAGFRVLRVWNNEVLTNIDGVVEAIWNLVRTPPPIPAFPLRGKE